MNLELGRRNRATQKAYTANRVARRRAARVVGGHPSSIVVDREFETVPRNKRPDVEDRWGRRKGLTAPDGRAFSPCPMCEKRSMLVVGLLPGTEARAHWRCESCGYEDTEESALV